MNYEIIPQVTVLRGGTKKRWCSIMTHVESRDPFFEDIEKYENWVAELETRDGFIEICKNQYANSIVIDISVDPNLPAHALAEFQAFLAQGLHRAFKIKAQIEPFIVTLKLKGT